MKARMKYMGTTTPRRSRHVPHKQARKILEIQDAKSPNPPCHPLLPLRTCHVYLSRYVKSKSKKKELPDPELHSGSQTRQVCMLLLHHRRGLFYC